MTDTVTVLSTLELERRVSVAEAARLKGVSEDTFRRHYSHLIEQVSPRRQAVKLKHVIAENAA
jgi:DeoR/GlpR family transcriptional regulator of sugar metabolism